MAKKSDREILDEVTLLLRKAIEAKNGTALGLHDGAPLSGFVLEHHDYMRMHCLLELEARDYSMAAQEALGSIEEGDKQ